MNEKLAALYVLQQQDVAIDALKRQYATLNNGKSEHRTYAILLNKYQEMQKVIQTTTTSLNDMELEQRAIEEKRLASETKLYSGKISDPKELQALQEEVDSLERRRDKLGEKIDLSLLELEKIRLQETQLQQYLSNAEKNYRNTQQNYRSEAEKLIAQAKILAGQRNQAVKNVEPTLLKRYETLRSSKAGLAIVCLEDGNACGGCKMGLPSSIISIVQEGINLETCDNCGRILFALPKMN